jgi:hypothetical protein
LHEDAFFCSQRTEKEVLVGRKKYISQNKKKRPKFGSVPCLVKENFQKM